MLVPVNVVVPAPILVTLPVPEMLLAIVFVLERLKTRLALLMTAPLPSVPAVPPLPTCRTPALIVVVPL